MKLKFRFFEYLCITSFVWGLYLIWLIPFQLYWVGMPWDMFVTWFVWGTIAEYIVAYPIAKAIVWGVPKITSHWQIKSDNSLTTYK